LSIYFSDKPLRFILMSENMEVIDVYVDSVVGSVATPIPNTAVSNVQASNNVKAVNTSDASNNTVRADSMDGENQQPVSTKKDSAVSAVYDGNKQNDTRTEEEKTAADNDKIKKAIENIKAQLPNSEVKFGIHEKTDRVTIKLVDKKTKEVIKEFPPEKTLDMIAKCMEIAGVLVDEKL
jgi:flagellar protein FlaG